MIKKGDKFKNDRGYIIEVDEILNDFTRIVIFTGGDEHGLGFYCRVRNENKESFFNKLTKQKK